MRIYARQGFAEFVLAPVTGPTFSSRSPSSRCLERPGGRHRGGHGDRRAGRRVRIVSGAPSSPPMATASQRSTWVIARASTVGTAGSMTLTAVPLPSPYGTHGVGRDRAASTRFVEKPSLPDHWINAGFFVMDEKGLRSLAVATTSNGSDARHGRGRRALRLPARGLLAVDGHLQGRLELSTLCREGEEPWTTCRDPGARHRGNGLHRLASPPGLVERQGPRSMP